jgi:hypothetical protein
MNKNKIILFIGIIGAVVIGVILLLSAPDPHKYDQYKQGSHPAKVQAEQPQTPVQSTFETLSDTQGSVTVNATPTLLSSKDLQWKFDVGFNTHSVELDQDITQIAVLVDDSGKEYKPIRWEGAGPGGHHREGTLVFNQITPMPKTVTLKILGVDAPVRSFVWNITN